MGYHQNYYILVQHLHSKSCLATSRFREILEPSGQPTWVADIIFCGHFLLLLKNPVVNNDFRTSSANKCVSDKIAEATRRHTTTFQLADSVVLVLLTTHSNLAKCNITYTHIHIYIFLHIYIYFLLLQSDLPTAADIHILC